MDTPQDEDCARMLRLAGGDGRAFEELFDRHQASVVRFASRFVGDGARGEELAQEIFVSLYRAAPRYRPHARFKTWLYRVATHHCLNAVRGTRPSPRAGDGDGDAALATLTADPAHGPAAAVEGQQLLDALAGALARLPERERAAFCLCRFEGLSYRDIAETLETSESAVKSLVHRATVALARCAEAHGGTP